MHICVAPDTQHVDYVDFKYSAELFDRSAMAYFMGHSVYAFAGTYLGMHDGHALLPSDVAV